MTNHNDNDIVFCSPLRTPVGRYGGVFKDVPVEDLATTVVDAIVERTGITAKDVDDIILGQAGPNGAAPALGRIVALNRSEEHTSELQSRGHLVCRLLLEKKNRIT